MRAALDYLVFLGLLLVELIARSLPPGAALALADGLGRIWYRLDGRRRRRARESLRIAALGGLEVDDPEALVRQTFRALMMVPMEVFVFPRYFRNSRDMVRRTRFHGDIEAFREDVRAGRGGVAIAGHFGSWELAAWALRFLEVPARVVVRPINNPWVDRRTASSRGGAGAVIQKRGAVRQVLQSLREGAWVAILADQNAGAGGPFIPFFGTPASTFATPAVAAARVGVPVWAAACIRRQTPPFTYELHLKRLPEAPADLDERAGAVHTLTAFKRALEGWIALAPEQYNWIHRRWRSRPAGEVPTEGTPRYEA